MLFEIITFLLLFAAVFAYVNERYLHLPDTIGVMLLTVVVSSAVYVMQLLDVVDLRGHAEDFLEEMNFSSTLLHGMIAFLLFSGALNVRMADMAAQKWLITALAIGSTVLSCIFLGTFMWVVLNAIDIEISYISALVFGAIISPTDPIACLGILKKVGMPARLQILIEGESLFNDGMGVVVFLCVMGVAQGGAADPAAVAALFGQQAIGGLFVGAVTALIAFYMLNGVKHGSTEALIMLALVSGCFLLAEELKVSGLIAMVVCGLVIGNYGRELAVTQKNRHHHDAFWEIVDEVLNVVLFMMIGVQLIVVEATKELWFAAALAVPLALAARWLSVAIPVVLLRIGPQYQAKKRHIIWLLTWGGLRGGLSLAMVLSLPPSDERDLFMTMTFAIVVFSIAVQGLTIGRMYTRERLLWIAKDTV